MKFLFGTILIILTSLSTCKDKKKQPEYDDPRPKLWLTKQAYLLQNYQLTCSYFDYNYNRDQILGFYGQCATGKQYPWIYSSCFKEHLLSHENGVELVWGKLVKLDDFEDTVNVGFLDKSTWENTVTKVGVDEKDKFVYHGDWKINEQAILENSGSISLTFFGNGVKAFGERGENNGEILARIDQNQVKAIDQYSRKKENFLMIDEKLSKGWHTISLYNNGRNPLIEGNHQIVISGFEVYNN